jgi:hypothetical protein
MIRTFILALVLCSLWGSAGAAEKTRILFIGNSYTRQIRATVTALIEASSVGGTTELAFITRPGKTLEFHLGDAATVAKIAEGNGDDVVLQDQSQMPAIAPKRFEVAAIELDKLIDATGAKTVFYQTWGRRDGDKQNAKRFPTYDSMQTALSESYATAARSCDAILAPVGDTWARVRADDSELGRGLYKNDASHPSAKGAYLTACVFYAALFQKDADQIDFNSGLSAAEEKVIHQAIGKVVVK